MPTDAFDMAIVHRVFRNELHNAPKLIRDVNAGDRRRSAIVGDHLNFIVAALHHHHAAEDELIWPKLHAPAGTHVADIARMQDQHRGVAEAVAQVQSLIAAWVTSADSQRTDGLVSAVEDLSARVDERLADEELNAVPLINEYISPGEWQEAIGRAAEFLSRKNLWLGLVLGGYVLDAATDDEGRRLLANVPLPKRFLAQRLGKRPFTSYQKKIYRSVDE
jgi:hemerythrin-like domain-containing protein